MHIKKIILFIKREAVLIYFITKHSEKHAFKPNVKSTKKSTKFNEHIDVAKLREDTLLHPDKIDYRKRSKCDCL